jgi:putative transposase
MDERYLLACVRYIENNPVRAKLVMTAEQWLWSSVAAHISGKNDNLVNVAPILSMIRGSWRQFLSSESLSDDMEDIRKHERTGRPLGSRSFVEQLENKIGRILKPQKPGRKPQK